MEVYNPRICGTELLVVVVNGGGEVEQGFARANDEPDPVLDVVEGIILAHASAGIDVMGPRYIEGIETALEGLMNNG